MTGQPHDLSDLLIQAHFASQLHAYGGNLAFAISTVQNGWLAAEGDPGIQEHLVTLRRHLANLGHPEDDSFLLRLGLAAPGALRGIVPPVMVLDANRGGFSARRQREAEGQVRRLREALAIGRRFIPNLSRNTQEAIFELSEFCQNHRAPDEEVWLDWFNELTRDKVSQLAERAIDCLDGNEKSVQEIGSEILQHLACFCVSPLNEVYAQELIERETFWPSSMYRDSSDAVARQLISRIEETFEQLPLNHLLLALAWTRSAAAHEAFSEWRHRRPAWAGNLHVPPEVYLHSAGWCLDEHGRRRDLISTICFRLVPVEGGAKHSVPCRIRDGEQCPSCGGPGALLFDFSQLDAVYFPGEFADAPRRVRCCLHCSCYGPVYTTYCADGTGTWRSPIEPRERYPAGDPKPCMRKLDESPLPPFACAEPFGLKDASTLGGIPMWLQDAEYPRCIECERVMTFLAQHDNGLVGEEGIYYAFFCARCHVAAVSYQQT
jgi:hypothetical protein